MIYVLPRFLSDEEIQRAAFLGDSSHHDEELDLSTKKPHLQPWFADIIWYAVSDLPIHGLASVDPAMQVYRLKRGSSVPLHTDEDYTGLAGRVARYSVLLRLNEGYVGGETRFFGRDMPSVPVGGGVVFRHDVPHEGLLLFAGEKLVLKTDLFVEG